MSITSLFSGGDKSTAMTAVLQMLPLVKRCDLSSNNISHTHAAAMADAIVQSTTLLELDLSFNELGNYESQASNFILNMVGGTLQMGSASQSVTPLVRAVTDNCSLTCLNLLGNHLTAAEARSLTRAAEARPQLVTLCGCQAGQLELTMTARYLQDADGILLASELGRPGMNASSVTEIDLSGNQLGDEGCLALKAAMAANKTVRRLCLLYNRSPSLSIDHTLTPPPR